jgi:hypothetical protein
MPDDLIPISPASSPFCNSAETRERTSSKPAQQARISVNSRATASRDIACRSLREDANEMPSVALVPG